MNKEDIKQLQILEQSLHTVHHQRQQFQAQLVEVESALSELDKAKIAYKIVGNIMINANTPELKKDLQEKKELFSARLKVLEKQESKFQQEAGALQQKLMKEMKE